MIASNFEFVPMANPIKILHLEDSLLDHQLVCRALEKAGLAFSIERVEDLPSFTRATGPEYAWDVILGDYRLEGFTALDAWHILQSQSLAPPFLIVSGAIGESAVADAMQQGISDFVHKDELHRLERVIVRAIEMQQARRAKQQALSDLQASEQRITELVHYLQTAIEGERAAIARDIHDDIGGALTAAKLDLAWIVRNCADAPSQLHAQAAVDMLQHAMGASQRIMMNLRPSILDQGLLAAVDWLVTGFEKRTSIPVTLRCQSDLTGLSSALQLVAFRLVQEALTNVAKYAHCSQVWVDVSDAQGVLTVEVRDDGCGIDPAVRSKTTAFGLRGLQERARMVGGWLDVSSSLGMGTALVLTVPLSGELPAVALGDVE
jgi:signal transduction histidine kinase